MKWAINGAFNGPRFSELQGSFSSQGLFISSSKLSSLSENLNYSSITYVRATFSLSIMTFFFCLLNTQEIVLKYPY